MANDAIEKLLDLVRKLHANRDGLMETSIYDAIIAAQDELEELRAIAKGSVLGMGIREVQLAAPQPTEDVCEWTYSVNDCYDTACGNYETRKHTHIFCPYCGKPIKVKEHEDGNEE